MFPSLGQLGCIVLSFNSLSLPSDHTSCRLLPPTKSSTKEDPGHAFQTRPKTAVRAKSGCYTCRLRRKVRCFQSTLHVLINQRRIEMR
jgi:hypothetical protein